MLTLEILVHLISRSCPMNVLSLDLPRFAIFLFDIQEEIIQICKGLICLCHLRDVIHIHEGGLDDVSQLSFQVPDGTPFTE